MENNPEPYVCSFESKEDEEEFNLVYEYIVNNPAQFLNVHKGKRDNTVRHKPSLWDSSWGKMLKDPRLENPGYSNIFIKEQSREILNKGFKYGINSRLPNFAIFIKIVSTIASA